MSEFRVVEKKDPLAHHAHTWSKERGDYWIEHNGDSKGFMDKTLTKASFKVVEYVREGKQMVPADPAERKAYDDAAKAMRGRRRSGSSRTKHAAAGASRVKVHVPAHTRRPPR